MFVSEIDQSINGTSSKFYFYESYDLSKSPANTGEIITSFNKCIPLNNINFGIPNSINSLPVKIPLGNYY